MPLYEYKCKKCGRKVEKIRKFSDPPLTTCESCGGKLEQLLSSPAIRFKGSGFYVNDYARKSSDPSSTSSADSAPSTDKKETAKDKGTEKGKESSKPSESATAGSSKT
ncbi:MAG: FmdB family zinc ribbon protein [Terriglobia bacterium]